MRLSVKYLLTGICLTLSLVAQGQVDRHDVRAGNRKFRKDKWREAEIDYRKAVVKDSMSIAGQYNLANDLYRQGKYDEAVKPLDAVKDVATGADYFYNRGDVALQMKDYAGAVEAFKQSLLRNPGDMDAKENYIYAKKMLENQDDQGGGGDQDQDQDDQNQDDQNQDQQQDDKDNQPQQQSQDRQKQQQDDNQPQISPQQAQQMLQAIQAKEKETQDKVNKEKAEALKSRQKEKNW